MVQWTGWGPISNITLGGSFSAASPIQLPACAAHDFQLHHTAPVFTVGQVIGAAAWTFLSHSLLSLSH